MEDSMEKMAIIITMAGLGSRFRRAGYDCPKYMIEAKGKTLFDWSLDSLIDYNAHVERYIFVVRQADQAEYFIRQHAQQYGLKNIVILPIEHPTDGQATTALLATQYCLPNQALLIYNIDTYVTPHALKYIDISGQGHIPCFHAPGEHWSFVKLDTFGNVVEVREKVRISDNCTLGAYYFSSVELYRQLYQEYYADQDNIEKKEKYIAPLYNYMIQKGMKVTISIVDAQHVHVLGTPEELKNFLAA